MNESTTCASCGKPIDTLRAGEVALVGSGFLYFCNKACKSDHFDSRVPLVAQSEIETAEPPNVDLAKISLEEENDAPLPEEERLPPPPSLVEINVDSGRGREDELAFSIPRVFSFSAVILGLLAVGLPLVGAVAFVVRTPIAVTALVLALAREVVATYRLPREGWVLRFSMLGTGLALVWTHVQGAEQEGALASFAGLAAVVSIATRVMLDRAREPVARTRQEITQGLSINARVVQGSSERILSAEEVRAGETLLVHAGESVAADGVILSGDGVVVPWLGATTEMKKREGDAVVAGANVLRGSLRMTATWTGDERAFSRLALSRSASAEIAAPLSRMARSIALRAGPVAALLAGLACFANEAPLSFALGAACAVLFGFAADATAAAVALTFAEAHLRAQRSGIVYKDANGFDRAGTADIAVTCARGTLLLGEPEIVAIESLGTWSTEQILSTAAGLANGSSHPFARAILRAAASKKVPAEPVRNTVHDGSGSTALDAAGERIVLGRRTFLLRERVGVGAADTRVSELEAQGRSALMLATAGKIQGLIGLQDGLRVGARAAIQRLLDAHIEPVMLSGESRETCETIAHALDIEHIRPEVLEADRGAEIRSLALGGNVVAVIGHPTMDDGALGSAGVSVALAAAGGAPGEWTVSLASDDVRDAVFSLTIPRVARERARIALFIGFAPGVISALGIALGLAPVGLAAWAALASATASILYARETMPGETRSQ